jgi:hypothetical protein
MGTDACAWRVCEIWFGGAATTPKGDSWRRLRRKPKTATDAAPEAAAAVGPRSPTVYDWFALFPSLSARLQFRHGWLALIWNSWFFLLCLQGGHQFVGPMNYSAIQRGEKVLKNLKKQNNQSSRGISMTKEAS